VAVVVAVLLPFLGKLATVRDATSASAVVMTLSVERLIPTEKLVVAASVVCTLLLTEKVLPTLALVGPLTLAMVRSIAAWAQRGQHASSTPAQSMAGLPGARPPRAVAVRMHTPWLRVFVPYQDSSYMSFSRAGTIPTGPGFRVILAPVAGSARATPLSPSAPPASLQP